MIWIVGLLMAFMFIKLGMLVVMVNLLEVALQVALLVIAGLGVALIWRKLFARKSGLPKVWQPKQITSKGE